MKSQNLEQIFWKDGKYLDNKGNEVKSEPIGIPSILVWRFNGNKRDYLNENSIKNYHFENVLNGEFTQTLSRCKVDENGNFYFAVSNPWVTYWDSKDKTSLESEKDINKIFEYEGKAAIQFYKRRI